MWLFFRLSFSSLNIILNNISYQSLHNQPSGTPIGQHAEVICAAKKSLSSGTDLDGEGGYCVYGLLDTAVVARAENLLPVGLSQGAVLTRDIPEDGLVRYDDVELADSAAWELRQLQDAEVGEKN